MDNLPDTNLRNSKHISAQNIRQSTNLSGSSCRCTGTCCWAGLGGIPVTFDSPGLEADDALEFNPGLAGSELLDLLLAEEAAVEAGDGRLEPAEGSLLPAALFGRRALDHQQGKNMMCLHATFQSQTKNKQN